MNKKATILPRHSGNQGTPASPGFSTCSVHLGCLFVLYCYVLVFFLLYFLMCSLHFLESSGRTVVTAWRWHCAGSVIFLRAFLVQWGEPLILTVDHWWRRRDKSSSSYLNCIDWLPVSSHPPLHPPHRSPVSQAGQSNSAGKPETLPTPALWLDRCEKKEVVVVETCHVGMTPPDPPTVFRQPVGWL